jgi:K+-transporting ATPase ATPase C chain
VSRAGAAGAPARTPLGHLRAAALLLAFAVVTGGLGYPLVVTGFAQLVVPGTANGSLVDGPNGTVVGSILVAQNLSLPWLFWPRVSVIDYNMLNGSPAPPGPGDPALKAEILAYLEEYRNFSYNGTNQSLSENLTLWLVTDSGSGIDPDLQPEDALVQIPRIAWVTHLPVSSLQALVDRHTQEPPGGIPGPKFVNVLELDIALEQLLGV